MSRGQVALPGGKTDPEDISPEATARREGAPSSAANLVVTRIRQLTLKYGAAFEEVGLPLETNAVRYLTTLPPFLSRSLLLVTPVVVFILDSSLKASSVIELIRPASLKADIFERVRPAGSQSDRSRRRLQLSLGGLLDQYSHRQ